MNKLITLTLPELTKAYCLLTKPRIILGNLITMAAGFSLAAKEYFDFLLFLATLIGLSLVIASACIFNNYIDKETDKKMSRTKNRALAAGSITAAHALFTAYFLLTAGCICLGVWTNLLTLSIALTGFLVYVCLYSFSKYHTAYGTLMGSIAGAVPPVIGYVSVQSQLDLCAAVLFAMLVLWQMPHFFAIALYRLEDYSAAAIPVLPLKKGVHRTKIQMIIYIIAFIATSSLLYVFNYTGFFYLSVVVSSGLLWMLLSLKGFKAVSDQKWARSMFIFSLVVIMAASASIFFSA